MDIAQPLDALSRPVDRAAAGVPFLDLAAMHREVAAELRERFGDVLAQSAFIGGAEVEAFEREWAAYCGVAHCVGVANGTDAIQLVLEALGVGRGDEVVVPANTFAATAAAVARAGATPRFADVDPDTLLLTPRTLTDALTPRTAAVIAVHLYGQTADMDALGAVARRAGIALIEDAAQAHGATWRGRRAGSMGVAGCFSFYPGKNLGALGDGGAVVTGDAALAERVRVLADHGRDPADRHRHVRVGVNSRLDGLQAAALRVKLTRLDTWNAGRRAAAAAYARALAGLAGLPVEPVRRRSESDSVHHLYVVRVAERDRVRAALEAAGIGTGVHYPVPCHLQPAFDDGRRPPSLPRVERAAREILSLPMYPHLGERQVAVVADALAMTMRRTVAHVR